MTTSLHETGPRADRDASISLASGLLALAAVCVAIMPVPFTGYVCFPAAVILAALAGVYSVRALRRFRVLTGNDRAMSFAGLIAGTATLALTAASVVLVVMLGHRLIEAMWRIVPQRHCRLPMLLASMMLATGSGKVPAGFLVFKTCGGSHSGPRWVRLTSTPAEPAEDVSCAGCRADTRIPSQACPRQFHGKRRPLTTATRGAQCHIPSPRS